MSFSKITRNFQPIKGRKLNTADITADLYTRSLSEAAKRTWGGVKECARAIGLNRATAKNLWEEKNGLNGVNLIRAMRESDEVLNAVLHLAGRGDIAEKAKALASVQDAIDALNRLKAGQ